MKFVQINNLRNEDIVPHQILLINGTVDSTMVDKLCIACNNMPVHFLSYGNNFRALVQLKLGKNSVHFMPMNEFLDVFYVPSISQRFVRVLLVSLKDQIIENEFEEKLLNIAIEKVSLGAKLLQCFVAEELKTKFDERKTFRFENESDFSVCRSFRSEFYEKDLGQLKNEDVYWKIAKEIIDNHDNVGSVKYLAVLYCTKFCASKKSTTAERNWDDIMSLTKFYVNYGRGNVAIVHGGGLYAWPDKCNDVLRRFMDKTVVEPDFLNDSAGRGTIGGVYATTLGMALHELGHLFDLVHTGTGIMGRGFDNLQLAFVGEYFQETVAKQNESRHNGRVFSSCERNHGSKFSEEINYHFADHCLTVLNYHKWFNNVIFDPDRTNAEEIKINASQVTAERGLVLSELRTKTGETCLWWDLCIYKPKQWIIPAEIMKENNKFDLFLMDTCGFTKLFQLR